MFMHVVGFVTAAPAGRPPDIENRTPPTLPAETSVKCNRHVNFGGMVHSGYTAATHQPIYPQKAPFMVCLELCSLRALANSRTAGMRSNAFWRYCLQGLLQYMVGVRVGVLERRCFNHEPTAISMTPGGVPNAQQGAVLLAVHARRCRPLFLGGIWSGDRQYDNPRGQLSV